MAIQLGSAYGKVDLDVKGLLSNVLKGKQGLMNLATVGQQVGGAMKNVGNMMTVGLTLPIAALGAASIKAASNFEETKNKAVVVFGEMADSVVANSNRAATALGVSKTQYLDYASSIGAALTAGGMSVKEATELSEQAVKHFADLASFHNTQVEDASLAWQSAIRGQFEPIQKFFPFITNQYLITYGTANGLIDANTKQLTANQRAVILNAIALDEKLNPAMNDFSETSKGLANQGRILKAQWQDSLVLLGQNLLPIALKVVSAFNGLLEAFNKLGPTQQKIVLGFLGFLALLGPVLSVVGTLITTVSGIVGAISTLSGLGISLGAIGTVITGTLIPAIGAVVVAAGPVLLVIAAIAAVVYLLYLAWKNNFLGIQDIVRNFIARLKGILEVFVSIRQGAIKLFEDGSGALLDLAVAFGFPEEAAQEFLAKIYTIVDKFREIFSRAREFIVNAFTKTDWGQLGKFIVFGIANGLLLGIPGLVLAAAKAVEAVLKTFDDKLDMHSPSKVMEKRGVWSALGFGAGWNKAMNPNDVAQMMAKPLLNTSNSQQQNITMQFANGLTTRQVQGMIDQNSEQIMNTMISALGGA